MQESIKEKLRDRGKKERKRKRREKEIHETKEDKRTWLNKM